MNEPENTELIDASDDRTQELPPAPNIAAHAGAAEQPVFDGPRAAAESAKPLSLFWIENALLMLRASARSSDAEVAADPRIALALETVRRHFHTDRRGPTATEGAAIEMVRLNFEAMRRTLSASDSIFITADDETASKNTRGYFGSGLIVAAYAYTQKSISFTSHFPGLGTKCRAAVIIHQLAHFIDARMRDHSCGGLIYDSSDFETSLFNVHCYPNFAVNATPPYLDERYGLTRPEA